MENEIIKELIIHIEEELRRLKSKQNISLEDYINNWEIQHVVERAFHKVIQGCIDIGARIIAMKNLPKPTEYHGIFDELMREKVISEKLSRELKEMVGFRNALTHEYRKIDNKEVYRHLQQSLDRFNEFIKVIEKL